MEFIVLEIIERKKKRSKAGMQLANFEYKAFGCSTLFSTELLWRFERTA